MNRVRYLSVLALILAACLAVFATEELPYRRGTIAEIDHRNGRTTAVVELEPLPGGMEHVDSYKGESGTGYYEHRDANGDTVYSLQDTRLVARPGQKVHLVFWIGTAYFRPVIGKVLSTDGKNTCDVLIEPKLIDRTVTDPSSGSAKNIRDFFATGARVILTDRDG